MDSLLRALAGEVSGEVSTDDGTLAAYSSDASNHRVVPRGVVYPRGADDIAAVVRRCADAGVPITSRGGGTGVAGGAIGPGLVVDHSRHLNRILALDPAARTAIVEPGVVLDRLQERAAAHGLRFGPDPSTHNRCTLGGMIGTNACGSHSVAWGTTAEAVRDLDIVRSDGARVSLSDGADLAVALERLRDAHLGPLRTELGRFGRQISGYGLQHLLPENGFDLPKAFTGSEGTCGIVTAATVGLVAPPPRRALVVAGFDDDVAAAAAAPVLAARSPLTVEGIDDNLVRAFDTRRGSRTRPDLPPGRAWLLVEVGGDAVTLFDACRDIATAARDAGALGAITLTSAGQRRAFWAIRERGAGLATRAADGSEAWPGWEDSAVPPRRLADYLGGLHGLLDEHGVRGVIYGHFGEGCVHVRITHDLVTPAGRVAYRRFQQDAADLVAAHGGSLSGEHGDGRARSELLDRMYSPRMLRAFAEFKRVFDPENLFNPGVLVDPRPLDADLRLAVNRPHTENLAFGYSADDGDWGKAMRRCVGVGACRKESGGGMCPSYRATRDERHSTRGRSRILFEMLDGRLARDGWRSRDVRDALDLCLGCKACASECPVNVDMATYKSEFLDRHYRRRPRPLSHYSMGWLPRWLSLARRFPRLANLVLGGKLAARLGGLDPRREVPRLSTRPWKPATIDDSARDGGPATSPPSAADRPALASSGGDGPARPHLGDGSAARDGNGVSTVANGRGPSVRDDRRDVTLWMDTFTASFAPEIGEDALHLLRAAGFRVGVVGPDVCCGLTWISTGQLSAARGVAARAVSRLAESPGPIVVLEPSCAAALRDDVPELLRTDAARAAAARVRTLAEALADSGLEFDTTAESVIGQFHCHQRAALGTRADRDLLGRIGIKLTSVDEGCCGLAGDFGFEAGHYDLSVACARQSFLPELERRPRDTVLADGFSCRLQIEQLGGRKPLHLAQLLRRRLREPRR